MRNKLLLSLFLLLLFTGGTWKSALAAGVPPVDFTYSGICVGSPTNFTVDAGVTDVANVSLWAWSFGDGVFSSLQNPVHTYAGPGIFPVTLTITDIFGGVGTITHNVTIKQLPIANFEFSTPDCNLEAVQFTDHSNAVNGFINKRVWDFGDGSAALSIIPPADPNPNHVFPNTNTFNVTLKVTNSDLCENQFTLPVTIYARPKANFYFTGECQQQAVLFTDASSANGGGIISSHQWDFRDPLSGIDQTSNAKNPSHIFANSGNYQVKLAVTNSNNCVDTISKLVSIRLSPQVDFTYTTGCLNKTIYFAPDPAVVNIATISTWQWDFGDGSTSVSKSPAYMYTVPGTYPVTLTVTDLNGCSNSVVHNITVDPLPVAHFSAPLSACAGTEVNFQNLSTPTVGYYITQWYWDFGDGNSLTVNHPGNPDVAHRYLTPNTYNVKLTITGSNGCTNIESQLVKILPNPVANFDYSAACIGTKVNFTDLTQPNGAGPINSWNWNFDDSGSGVLNQSGVQFPDHSFISGGNHAVQLIVAAQNTCTDTIIKTIAVKPAPAVNFNTSGSCQGNPVTFSPDASLMNVGAVSSWFWEFGGGNTSVIPNPTFSFATAGNQDIKLTIVDNYGCTSSISQSINIIPQPIAKFSFAQPVCIQSAVQFSNISDATPGTIVSSNWDFGDGNTQTVAALLPVAHTYAAAGTYLVKLTVTSSDGCTNSSTMPVNILAKPVANFTYMVSCLNTPVQFHDISQPGTAGITSWLWNFGDFASGGNNISGLQHPSHTFSVSGTYQVKLLVTTSGGCTDTIVKSVTIKSLPGVDFTFTSGCVNSASQFVSSTFVNSGAIQYCQWNFGDSGVSGAFDPAHIYLASGSYTVTLTVTDTAGCSNTRTKVVDVLASPTSVFTVSSQQCSNSPVQFTNASVAGSGTITSFHYEFGDGTDVFVLSAASANVAHTYASAGVYVAKLTVHTSLGCESVSQQTIIVSASPHAQFTFDNTCEGAGVNFSDISTPGGGTAVVKWSWNFGDPFSLSNNISSQQNPSHVYNTNGIYTVNLNIENATGCKALVSKTVFIKAKPPVDFTWNSACLGNSTNFAIDPSVTSVGNIATFEWDFGDGTPHNTTQKNPVHTYATTSNYTVTLSIITVDGCKNSITHTVNVLQNPSAIFSAVNVCSGTIMQFNDQSIPVAGIPIKSWSWDFGVSGTLSDTSTLQNPQWLFPVKGVYNVKLSVTALNGCKDMVIRPIQVFGSPTADFSYTASACENGKVDFQNVSFSQQSAIASSDWLFEANSTSNIHNPTYVFYNLDSCYDVRLIVKDTRGCIDTVTKPVCVPAEYDFTFATSSNCINDTTYFTPKILSPVAGTLVKFNWDFGDAASGVKNTSTLKVPFHYYAKTGTYTVSLEATDENNCKKTIYKNVTINPRPLAAFTYTPGLCDSTIFFDESSYGNGVGISKWIWNFGDGATTTITSLAAADITHQYPAPGVYDATLTVVNTNGCSNQAVNTNVLVKPCLSASFELSSSTQLCQNNYISFINTSSSSVLSNIWYWEFGDGTHATYDVFTNQVNHKYKYSGAYKVQMVIYTYLNGRVVSDTSHLIVNISPSPRPDFTFSNVCNQQTAYFTNITSGSGTKIVGYSWSFGEPVSNSADTSTLKDPSHTYRGPGTYEVTLTAKNNIGCVDSIQKELVVNGLPMANFRAALSCAGQKTVFTDLSTEAGDSINRWKWIFNDNMGIVGGKDVKNPEFVFKKPGDYLVNLKVTDINGCSDSVSQFISTWDVPVSKFSIVENYGDVQGQLQLVNSSVDAIRYHWTFGNGDDSYAPKPVETFRDEGSYPIRLVVYNEKGCSDTAATVYNFMVKGLFIPNAFSPLNPMPEVQLLKPVGINLKEYRFEVFDRWGNLLWWTDKLDDLGQPVEGWDGKYKDVLLPEGVYPWRASAVFRDGTIWHAENVGNSDHLPKYRVGTATMMR